MNLNEIELDNNFVLVKPDPDFEYVEVEGGYKLLIGRDLDEDGNDVNYGRHVSISGEVIRLPKGLVYHGYVLNDPSCTLSTEERQSMAQTSMEWDTDIEFNVGARVIFDYTQHKECAFSKRIFEVDGIGKCMAIPYGTIYGYVNEDVVEPVNGYIFIKRDLLEGVEKETEDGIVVIHLDQRYLEYGSKFATVVKSSQPVRDYLGKRDPDFNTRFGEGDRILLKPKRGFRIAYDIHAKGFLRDIEVIRSQSVLAKIINN